MSDKKHKLAYSRADWDKINAIQESKWASKSSDVTVIKPDGTTQIIPNEAKLEETKKLPFKKYKQKRQAMFEGDI